MESRMELFHVAGKLQTEGGVVGCRDKVRPYPAWLQLPGGEALQPQVGCRQEHVLTYKEWGRVAFLVSL